MGSATALFLLRHPSIIKLVQEVSGLLHTPRSALSKVLFRNDLFCSLPPGGHRPGRLFMRLSTSFFLALPRRLHHLSPFLVRQWAEPAFLLVPLPHQGTQLCVTQRLHAIHSGTSVPVSTVCTVVDLRDRLVPRDHCCDLVRAPEVSAGQALYLAHVGPQSAVYGGAANADEGPERDDRPLQGLVVLAVLATVAINVLSRRRCAADCRRGPGATICALGVFGPLPQ
mmetsp:Transcript_18974/g.47430  ORF Transcript_18974/g.47430 Transcript_18974/m.47430 type:complete len:226 (+) Transcript_18974:341-1018(+)